MLHIATRLAKFITSAASHARPRLADTSASGATMRATALLNSGKENVDATAQLCTKSATPMPVATNAAVNALRVKRLSDKATLPVRGSAGAAGYDLASAKDMEIPARGRAVVPTDLSIAIPEGTYARVAPRSGLAVKNFIDTGAGVIDEDYRGPVGVVLFNHSDVAYQVKQGDRIAQLILERITTPPVIETEDLDMTVRGSGGFGSTGVSAKRKADT